MSRDKVKIDTRTPSNIKAIEVETGVGVPIHNVDSYKLAVVKWNHRTHRVRHVNISSVSDEVVTVIEPV